MANFVAGRVTILDLLNTSSWVERRKINRFVPDPKFTKRVLEFYSSSSTQNLSYQTHTKTEVALSMIICGKNKYCRVFSPTTKFISSQIFTWRYGVDR